MLVVVNFIVATGIQMQSCLSATNTLIVSRISQQQQKTITSGATSGRRSHQPTKVQQHCLLFSPTVIHKSFYSSHSHLSVHSIIRHDVNIQCIACHRWLNNTSGMVLLLCNQEGIIATNWAALKNRIRAGDYNLCAHSITNRHCLFVLEQVLWGVFDSLLVVFPCYIITVLCGI